MLSNSRFVTDKLLYCCIAQQMHDGLAISEMGYFQEQKLDAEYPVLSAV